MSRFIVTIMFVFVLAFSANTVRGQIWFATDFDSPADIGNPWFNWQSPMRAWSHRVADGNLYVGFSLEEMLTAPGDHPWGTMSNRGFARSMYPQGNPFEVSATMFIDSVKLTNSYTWSQDLSIYGVNILSVGAYDSRLSGDPVWRIGITGPYTQTAWTNSDIPVTEGWHTVTLQHDGLHFGAYVDGTLIGSGTLTSLHMGVALSGWSHVDYSNDYASLMFAQDQWPSHEIVFGSVEFGPMTAVPEPSTWATIAGALALGFVAVRRHSRQLRHSRHLRG